MNEQTHKVTHRLIKLMYFFLFLREDPHFLHTYSFVIFYLLNYRHVLDFDV